MKKIKYLLWILITLLPNVVNAYNLEYVACGNAEGIPAPVPQLTSICYTLLVVATPIILIIFSIVALVKAITGGNADAIQKAKDKVIKKFISAALVFFVASIVQFVVSRAATTDGDKNSAVDCINCMLYNDGCAPSTAGDDAYQANTRPPAGEEQVSNPSGNNNGNNQNNNGTVHISSINNIKYNLYSQADSRWGSVQYSSGDTIKDIGCMITAVSVLSSAHDSSITPKTVFDSYRSSHPYTSVPSLSGNNFTCSMVSSPSAATVKQNLRDGNVVIIKVYGKNKGGSSNFTSSQHYIALIDINRSGDQVFIGNGYESGRGYGDMKWYSSDEVLTSVQTAEICVPSQTLIDKYK